MIMPVHARFLQAVATEKPPAKLEQEESAYSLYTLTTWLLKVSVQTTVDLATVSL